MGQVQAFGCGHPTSRIWPSESTTRCVRRPTRPSRWSLTAIRSHGAHARDGSRSSVSGPAAGALRGRGCRAFVCLVSRPVESGPPWCRLKVDPVARGFGVVVDRMPGSWQSGRWPEGPGRSGRFGLAGGGRPPRSRSRSRLAIALEREDCGVVHEPVDHGGGDDLVAEDLAPGRDGLVAGDDQVRAPVAAGDEREHQVGCHCRGKGGSMH